MISMDYLKIIKIVMAVVHISCVIFPKITVLNICTNPECNNPDTFYIEIPKVLSPLPQLSLGRGKRPSALY